MSPKKYTDRFFMALPALQHPSEIVLIVSEKNFYHSQAPFLPFSGRDRLHAGEKVTVWTILLFCIQSTNTWLNFVIAILIRQQSCAFGTNLTGIVSEPVFSRPQSLHRSSTSYWKKCSRGSFYGASHRKTEGTQSQMQWKELSEMSEFVKLGSTLMLIPTICCFLSKTSVVTTPDRRYLEQASSQPAPLADGAVSNSK